LSEVRTGRRPSGVGLGVSEPGGKVRHISLRPEQKSMVEGWIKNYHHLKEQIEEVCQLNQTLLRPEP
jgi:hypothetical protein